MARPRTVTPKPNAAPPASTATPSAASAPMANADTEGAEPSVDADVAVAGDPADSDEDGEAGGAGDNPTSVDEPDAAPVATVPACAHAWERGRLDGAPTYHCPRCGAHKPR